MSDHLQVTIADGVCTLTMNRPEARNALSSEMRVAFAQTVPRIAADEAIRAVILTGAGGAFSGGGDIRAMLELRGTLTVESGRRRMHDVQPWMRQLVELDKPLVAAVDGPAFGAGFSLALMADFVLVTPRARFGMAFAKIGLVPDFAALYTLPRVVGVQRAKELMLSAREVDADEALRLGIAMEIVPVEALLARAQALARSFVGASPLAVSLVKREVGMALATDLRTTLSNEADHQALCFQSSYHGEAIQRFLDKQPAKFDFQAAAKAASDKS
jgi:2-(1,2-epoxy-1,2-dihydrophenyl)acetyl-CoA isomerase